MEKIKADVQEKGDLGLVAEVCSLVNIELVNHYILYFPSHQACRSIPDHEAHD